VTAKLLLTNPREPLLGPMEVEALADTGPVYLCIPEHVRLQAFVRGKSLLSTIVEYLPI